MYDIYKYTPSEKSLNIDSYARAYNGDYCICVMMGGITTSIVKFNDGTQFEVHDSELQEVKFCGNPVVVY